MKRTTDWGIPMAQRSIVRRGEIYEGCSRAWLRREPARLPTVKKLPIIMMGRANRVLLYFLERETGLEPATFCLEGRHSTN